MKDKLALMKLLAQGGERSHAIVQAGHQYS